MFCSSPVYRPAVRSHCSKYPCQAVPGLSTQHCLWLVVPLSIMHNCIRKIRLIFVGVYIVYSVHLVVLLGLTALCMINRRVPLGWWQCENLALSASMRRRVCFYRARLGLWYQQKSINPVNERGRPHVRLRTQGSSSYYYYYYYFKIVLERVHRTLTDFNI